MPEKRPGAQATADAIPTPVSIGNTHVLQICPQDNLASWSGLQTLDALVSKTTETSSCIISISY